MVADIRTVVLRASRAIAQEPRRYALRPCLAVLIFGLFGFFSVRDAEQTLNFIATPSGVLWSRAADRKDCERRAICHVIALGAEVLFSDYFTGIDTVLRSGSRVQLVVIHTYGGGSAVPPEYHLIDFTTDAPLILGKEGAVGMTFSRTASGVLFERDGNELDELGDTMRGLYRYDWGSGRVEQLREFPRHSVSALKNKKYPEELFSDPLLREPFLKAIGEKNFKEFRESFGLQGRLETTSQRFVSGTGRGRDIYNGGRETMFVLDTVKKAVWAIEHRNGIALSWGTLDEDDVEPKRLFNAWLTGTSLSWRDAVPQ